MRIKFVESKIQLTLWCLEVLEKNSISFDGKELKAEGDRIPLFKMVTSQDDRVIYLEKAGDNAFRFVYKIHGIMDFTYSSAEFTLENE